MDIGAEALSLGRLLVLQFARIFPFWMGGLVVGSLISVFARERIARAAALINERKWVAGRLALAAGVGVASPICMYGTIPILASLGRKGAPHYLLASFMVSSILLNPSLLVFSFALGAPLALLRLAVCLGAGMVAGVAVNALFKKAPLFSFDRFCAHNRRQDAAPGLREYLRELNAGIVRTTPYFLLGIALTALMDRYFRLSRRSRLHLRRRNHPDPEVLAGSRHVSGISSCVHGERTGHQADQSWSRQDHPWRKKLHPVSPLHPGFCRCRRARR
jgi:uncharacterized membrane protein YraQ (UPF0718 family)